MTYQKKSWNKGRDVTRQDAAKCWGAVSYEMHIMEMQEEGALSKEIQRIC